MKRWNEFLDERPSADFENRLMAEVAPLIEERKKNQSTDSWWKLWMGGGAINENKNISSAIF
jgi:hypothetical protein